MILFHAIEAHNWFPVVLQISGEATSSSCWICPTCVCYTIVVRAVGSIRQRTSVCQISLARGEEDDIPTLPCYWATLRLHSDESTSPIVVPFLLEKVAILPDRQWHYDSVPEIISQKCSSRWSKRHSSLVMFFGMALHSIFDEISSATRVPFAVEKVAFLPD